MIDSSESSDSQSQRQSSSQGVQQAQSTMRRMPNEGTIRQPINNVGHLRGSSSYSDDFSINSSDSELTYQVTPQKIELGLTLSSLQNKKLKDLYQGCKRLIEEEAVDMKEYENLRERLMGMVLRKRMECVSSYIRYGIRISRDFENVGRRQRLMQQKRQIGHVRRLMAVIFVFCVDWGIELSFNKNIYEVLVELIGKEIESFSRRIWILESLMGKNMGDGVGLLGQLDEGRDRKIYEMQRSVLFNFVEEMFEMDIQREYSVLMSYLTSKQVKTILSLIILLGKRNLVHLKVVDLRVEEVFGCSIRGFCWQRLEILQIRKKMIKNRSKQFMFFREWDAKFEETQA